MLYKYDLFACLLFLLYSICLPNAINNFILKCCTGKGVAFLGYL